VATVPRAAAQVPPAQADYAFVKIEPQGVGHCYLDAHGLNNARMVVVIWTDDCINYNTHASLWSNGTWTALDWVEPLCPDTGTQFESLTNNGVTFGTYWSSSCNRQLAGGIDVKTGKWFALPNPNGFQYNAGLSMSENGRATGMASNSFYFDTLTHWVWDGKRYSFPTFPAGWDVSAFWAGPEFINNAGQIAGQYVDRATGRMRGYFQDGPIMTSFDAPGDPVGTSVNGITNAGDVMVIGDYGPAGSFNPHSFSWRSGVFTSLPNVPYPDAVWTTVFAMNDRGDIAGRWTDINGLMHGFIGYRK
jgi:hypothetical protein